MRPWAKMSRPMIRRSAPPYRRPQVPQPQIDRSLLDRWYGKALLLLLTVLLLTLSTAPFKQFYLAWVGLVPWLIVLGRCRSPWSALGWSWIAGTAFFIANMWWLAYVTGPGMIALMAVLGLYWAAA